MIQKETAIAIGKTLAMWDRYNDIHDASAINFLQLFCNFNGIKAQQSFIRYAMKEWHAIKKKDAK